MPFWSARNRRLDAVTGLRPPVLGALLALGMISAALDGIGIGLTIPLLHVLTGQAAEGNGWFASALGGFADDLPDLQRALVIVAAILGLLALKNLSQWTGMLLNGWIYGRTSHLLRTTLVSRLTRSPLGFVTGSDPGRLLNILSNESWRVADAIQARIAIATGLVTGSVLLVFLLLLSWRMTLAVAIGLGIVQLLHGALSRRLRPASSDLARKNRNLANRMLHIIHSGRLVRLFNRQASEEAEFAARSEEVRRSVFLLDRRKASIGPIMEMMQSVLFLGVVIFALLSGTDFATIAAFLILLYRLQPQARTVQGAIAQLDAWTGSFDEVGWLLENDSCERSSSGNEPFRKLTNRIEFRDVSVSFMAEGAEVRALRGASFSLVRGRATAIVGSSGSGKTTLVNLLCRFLEPGSGAIEVDGVPLHTIDLVEWRSRIAVASLDLDLFDGTLAQNIAYGHPAADEAAVELAARQADLHDFVCSLPDGFSTQVGQRGENLSAGQRQRVILARAFIRDPEILILDEATNSLDALSETRITQMLAAFASRRTVIVISHHMSAIDFCQDVVVLRNGEVQYAGNKSGIEHQRIEDLLAVGGSR